jgi:hypothetical protein
MKEDHDRQLLAVPAVGRRPNIQIEAVLVAEVLLLPVHQFCGKLRAR